MLLVVVGNVERARVEQLVPRRSRSCRAAPTRGRRPPHRRHAASPSPSSGARCPRTTCSATSRGRPRRARTTIALRIATAVLSGRLFAEIRSRRNLSYAVDAPFVERAFAAGGAVRHDASTRRTTLASCARSCATCRRAGSRRAASSSCGSSSSRSTSSTTRRTPTRRTSWRARQLYRGDWRRAARFVEELRAVTPDDVRRVARQYLHDLRLAYIGDPAKLDQNVVKGF